MAELRFPTFSFSGFFSDIPTAEWSAARQALGIAIRDDAKWIKEAWAGIVRYGDMGVYSYNFDALDDALNSLNTMWNFELVLAASAGVKRYQRCGVAVDRANRTFVIATGAGTDTFDSGPDDWGVVMVVGDKANAVADAISNKCSGSLSRLGRRLPFCIFTYEAERSAVALYAVDFVKLKVTAGNPAHRSSYTTFDIDRW